MSESSSSAVEIDFFRLSRESSPKKLSHRRGTIESVANIQGVISKINPELLKTAIASANTSFVANKPVHIAATVAPMTVFFNGTISVFDVTPNQAESIMKLAEGANSVVKPEIQQQNQTIGGVLRNDLPMSRKRSLRRFLEKRKERSVFDNQILDSFKYARGYISIRVFTRKHILALKKD
ncbi:hypothetical protein SSX86_032014, partial [Deinandra increscens subsp. villosa]